MTDTQVTLAQMLLAREARAQRQQQMMARFGTPILSFTMNIPGPVKNSPLIRRSFHWGRQQLEERLTGIACREVRESVTGCEALYAVAADGLALKTLCVAIEEETPLGRLLDMDVLCPDGTRPDRLTAGGHSRDCIVCGAKGRGCASRRLHSVEELTAAARRLMEDRFFPQDAQAAGDLAVRSLLDEVSTTPKPGLVDRRNSGSHRDMDLALFTASAKALGPYYIECVHIGRETRAASPEVCFERLRAAGRRAEAVMYQTTRGVNTHKGAIFTLGLLCGSYGRIWKGETAVPLDSLLETCGALGECALQADFSCLKHPKTAGERLYASRGIRGVRGEAAAGLPSVRDVALPAYREGLSRGLSRNDAGAVALLHLIARVEDTNLLRRGGQEGAAWAARAAEALLPWPEMPKVEALDDAFLQKNLSPGGCADLLAATYFLDRLTNP